MTHKPVQQDSDGRLHHFLQIEGLSRETLHQLMDSAEPYLKERIVRSEALCGRTVVNLFFEPSTRTRLSFELAAKRLGAEVVNFHAAVSATSKGETLLDTIRNIEAMGVELFVIRHQDAGIVELAAASVGPGVSVLNAGDGAHAHPTQALLDMYTIRHHKQAFENLKIAIVGDVKHSRVARSQMTALQTLGAKEVRVIGPEALLPEDLSSFSVDVFQDIEAGLADVDVIILLRLQKERMLSALIPSEAVYFEQFGLDARRLQLAKPDAIVMHPGPMNRGVEIASEIADGPQSVIFQQVRFGVAVRMAVMATIKSA